MLLNLTSIQASNASASIYTISTVKNVTDWTIMALYLITAVLAIVGNIFVCLVIYNKKNLRSNTYILIVNMAVSDVIAGVMISMNFFFCSTLLLETGSFARGMCGVQKTIQILTYYVSAWTMAVIAIDRYRLVCKPLSSKMTPKWPIILIWSASAMFVTPLLFSVRVAEFFTPNKVRIFK